MTKPSLAEYSRFAQRVYRRYAVELSWLDPGVPTLEHLQRCHARLLDARLDTAAALRVLRHLVVERLLTLDCTRQATLADVTTCMTNLAEFALDIAVRSVVLELDECHGAPRTASGQRAQLWVVGMGKLGACELNVSSDIDLVYVYDEDGDTDGSALGRSRLSNHEYFARVVRGVYALVGDSTGHGFVFRVDLALRPHGGSGPAAVSLDALEEYLHVHGREWERFAWLKSRVVAPVSAMDDLATQPLRNVVSPFVFRKYLDYGVFEALRALHREIRSHALRTSAGRPERADDVKLGRGGIREIEFTVQLLQVVRGGQYPELRCRATLGALPRIVEAGLMPEDTARSLAGAYTFLREVEHRIQYLDDAQTHAVPIAEPDREWIAATMGMANAQELLDTLALHRSRVEQEFDTLLGASRAGQHTDAAALDSVLADLPQPFAEQIRQWIGRPKVLALRDKSRERLAALLLRVLRWMRSGKTTPEAILRLLDWLESVLRRESYLVLLRERPTILGRLLRLLGAARWPAKYLQLHPGVIDELADAGLLDERFDAAAFDAELERRRASLRNTGEDDEESLLNLLRRAHHAEVFRTLTRDVEGRLRVEEVADDLSALADAVLCIVARWCWERLPKAHRPQPAFGILAYGKLGGKELGYGSDLDLVFVYEDKDKDERAHEAYAALVRKLIQWLTVKTGEGDLYEIDTALRPNGNAGLLITSLESYAGYQQQRGSNTAWTWEHQAITRARCVLGDEAMRERFDTVRHAVLTTQRDADALREEVRAMRRKLAQAHPVPQGIFDIKHSPGGMIDTEFVTQFLVLSQSHQHAALAANVGNTALLERAESLGLLPEGLGRRAASAYRALRQAQHHARLDEAPAKVPDTALREEREAILTLWLTVFGE
ncbi:bifunctional [glutamate--ammonia ligase]-adenylyl-L-tyrosine phosphorylase/[glutamate--ammonia-ligase] adenylyltransferase [Candidatus Symbiobacter mobilis]|uniref:Bifunctional glutamine synthetase adenylyltransferase/adenylyl-removing enzyme n=1 Tax=Candidatus Symbiobacter mobilis CR TaxID=946483 RepID=U5N8T1_9BURK|nr:bifunctional [glutamate--ammonia ligase]-adenylyl-L-tyrosine phosphorylase/[glutamate--ammonia-ligase] adenylyltransferase [Candidatus Symbiobacter mobilis]AGX87941.1 glutamate-ammonia-ligase adenylyltransferase [Candidatus Symbiobacter mobilis CR]